MSRLPRTDFLLCSRTLKLSIEISTKVRKIPVASPEVACRDRIVLSSCPPLGSGPSEGQLRRALRGCVSRSQGDAFHRPGCDLQWKGTVGLFHGDTIHDKKTEQEGGRLMKLMSIEPTPSPHTMKLNLDRRLPGDRGITYTADNREEAPEILRRILEIPGVRSVFQVADFVSVERHPKADWREILAGVKRAFGEEGGTDVATTLQSGKGYGEVRVLPDVPGHPHADQTGHRNGRAGGTAVRLPERFMKAAMKAQTVSENFLQERRWEEKGGSVRRAGGDRRNPGAGDRCRLRPGAVGSPGRRGVEGRGHGKEGSGGIPLCRRSGPGVGGVRLEKAPSPRWSG